MERALSSFQLSVLRRLTERQLSRRGYGSWYYLPMAAAMEEAGFEDIGTYIMRRQNMVAQYISTRTIMDLCEQPTQRPGAWVSRRWWEQEGLDL